MHNDLLGLVLLRTLWQLLRLAMPRRSAGSWQM